MKNLQSFEDFIVSEATTVSFEEGKHGYDPKTRTFTMSERDVPFDSEYVIVNPRTSGSRRFQFVRSTGPEFDANTKWIYKSPEGFTFEVCNDPSVTKARAKAYLDHKLGRDPLRTI